MASTIAERAAGLIVQLMPAQLSIPSQESTERDPGPSAVIAKPTVSSTSGNSKPPSAAQIPFETCTLRIAVIITAPTRTVPTGVRSPAASEKPAARVAGGHELLQPVPHQKEPGNDPEHEESGVHRRPPIGPRRQH